MDRRFFNAFVAGFTAAAAVNAAIHGRAWWALVLTALVFANVARAMRKLTTHDATDRDE